MRPARMDDTVDVYHGVEVADPYRWLEDADTPETRAWLAEQQRHTAAYLAALPAREPLRTRLHELWNYPRRSLPRRRGNRIFFFENEGLQNQPVLYLQEDGETTPRLLLDPNTLSEDGTVALSSWAFNRRGTLLAYALSGQGSDWQEIHIRDIDTGHDLDETIRWCKFASIAWKHDDSGFFYNRLPTPGTVPPDEQYMHSRVYWHVLGTDQASDVLVYERPDAKELLWSPSITDDGAYLLLYGQHGTSPKNRLYYRPVASDGPFIRLLDDADAAYAVIDSVGTRLYVQTDLDAPRRRVIAIDLERPDRARWHEIIPEQDDVIDWATMVDDQLIVIYLHDAHHQIKVYDLDGGYRREIPLPELSTVTWLAGERSERAGFLTVTGFLHAERIFRYDGASGELSAWYEPHLAFDADAYETRQVFYFSKDGARVPMFLIHRRDLQLNGKNPTLLYGYGGFNVSMTPTFNVARLPWLERGGIYAVANLRGGDEYGEAWHEAGMLERKQNVFDDFIAAAEWLVAMGYTSTSCLAIMGGSNGGLLVGACLTQRPDLYGAVVCSVPVIDMLRYHRYTVGHFWTVEYGNAEADSAQFRTLYAYSPLHRVRRGTAYPPTLITTADHDDRVDPAHARKFAATLQAAQAGEAPILLRVEERAGHGAGKPIAKLIAEQADIFAFLLSCIGRGEP